MEEKFIEQIVFKRIMACGECDGGELVKTGHGRQNGQDMLFLHKCNGCGRHVDLTNAYPDLYFVPVHEADKYRAEAAPTEQKAE